MLARKGPTSEVPSPTEPEADPKFEAITGG